MVVCPSLMNFIELVETAFHTNPDGSLNVGAPLVPGIHAMEGGIAGYTTALRAAARGPFDDSDSLSSHDLRKDLCMDLEHSMSISDVIQRRIAGHAAGTRATYLTRESVERVRIELAATPKRPRGLPGR